jgi:hypothetical protein
MRGTAPFSVLLLGLLSIAARAQSNCTVELPVNVLGTDYSLLTGLAPSDITIRAGRQRRPIEKVLTNTDPRRILFVMDSSRSLLPDARKLEVKVVEHILASARPQDSFALIMAPGPSLEVRFGAGRDELLKAAASVLSLSKDTDGGLGMVDALMRASTWFGQPRLGDSIFLIASHLEDGPRPGFPDVRDSGPLSKASFLMLQEQLADRRIRVFGLQLGVHGVVYRYDQPDRGEVVTTPVIPGADTGPPTNLRRGELDRGSFPSLVSQTGGFAIWENTENPQQTYELTEARLRRAQYLALQAYGAIQTVYLLRVQAPANAHLQWELKLAKDLEKNTRLTYPHEYSACAEAKNAQSN